MKNANNIKLNSGNFDSVLNNILQDVIEPQENMNPDTKGDAINDQNLNFEIEDSTNDNVNNDTLLNKLDVMSINNGWNDKNEKIVISIGENASSYKWMHERSASMYKLIHKIFSIVLILFSTGLSAESIIPNDPGNVAISVLRRVFTYVITVLSVLQNFLNLEQLSEQHMSASNRYSELYHDIQKQMCMFRKDRNNATFYLSDVLKRYDSLVIAGPTINGIILNQFKNTFQNAEISIPDIADRIQKIEIITEPNLNLMNVQKGIAQNKNEKGIDRRGNKSEDSSQKRYARYGNSNLKQIHDVFKIHGDLTDNDIESANNYELRELHKKYLDSKSSFEYERFKKHNTETD